MIRDRNLFTLLAQALRDLRDAKDDTRSALIIHKLITDLTAEINYPTLLEDSPLLEQNRKRETTG